MSCNLKSRRVLLAAVTSLSIGVTAQAQLANGGFEEGFTGGVGDGWTLFATSGYNPSGVDETVNVHSGAHAQKIIMPQPAYGQGEGYGGVFQVFSTTPGQLYRIDFWMYASMPNENYEGEDLEIHLAFDAQGRPYYDHGIVGTHFDVGVIGVDADRNVWKSMGREFLAVSTQATLFFRYWRKWEQHGTGYVIIDDVTVTPVSADHPPSHAALPPPDPPTLVGTNLLANADFEGGFTGGVAHNWLGWSTRGAGHFKASSDLGKIGGGHYNPEEAQHVSQFLYLSETAKVAFAMPPALNQLVTIKQRDPEVLTVARHIDDNFNFWDKDDAGTVAEGYAHAERCYAKHLEKPGIDAWQGYNEPWVQTRERARKAGLFARAFSERCHQLGIRSVILNLGVGNPLQAWHAELFRDAMAVADFVGYHAYGGSTDQWQTGPQQDSFALRWRQIKTYYDDHNWRHPAVVYTEAGTYFGWKALGGVTAEMTRDKYIEFGPYMQADPWVVGEAIFTVGGYGLWDQWDIADDPVIIEGIRPWNQANSFDARGGKSQQWHHTGSNFRGGITQATATNPGQYWLAGWFKYETGVGGADPANPDVRFYIGYDPTGQTASGAAGTIVWTADQIASRHLNAYTWYTFGVLVTATGPQTSIWLAMDQPTALPTARFYVDAVDLRATDGTPPPQPEIELSTSSLEQYVRAGNDADDQSFTVRNAGAGLLAYMISDDAGWLTTVPEGGTSQGEIDTITVRYLTSALGMGSHTATITVHDPYATNDPQTIEVTLEVTAPGDFDIDGDQDQTDFGHMQICLTGSGNTAVAPGCDDADLDGDGDVDSVDVTLFARCLSGADVPVDPGCMD